MKHIIILSSPISRNRARTNKITVLDRPRDIRHPHRSFSQAIHTHHRIQTISPLRRIITGNSSIRIISIILHVRENAPHRLVHVLRRQLNIGERLRNGNGISTGRHLACHRINRIVSLVRRTHNEPHILRHIILERHLALHRLIGVLSRKIRAGTENGPKRHRARRAIYIQTCAIHGRHECGIRQTRQERLGCRIGRHGIADDEQPVRNIGGRDDVKTGTRDVGADPHRARKGIKARSVERISA